MINRHHLSFRAEREILLPPKTGALLAEPLPTVTGEAKEKEARRKRRGWNDQPLLFRPGVKPDLLLFSG
jgi:hypothetical protein